MKKNLLLAGAVAMLVLGSAPGADAAGSAKTYKNCASLNQAYRHGVGRTGAHDHVSSGSPVTNFTRNNSVYNANTGRDRDKDGIACEKH